MNGDNVINEKTKYSGGVETTRPVINSVATGLTAGTTQTQAGAVNPGTTFIRVSTTATLNDGLRLPNAVAGQLCVVTNAGAAGLKIWPATGEKINTGAANAADATVLATTKTRIYVCYVTADWTLAAIE